MQTDSELQKKLFQQIKEQLPAHLSLADEVSEVLHVSADSAYRRIRGEKPLTLPEASCLCRHFHLSLDALVHQSSNAVVFYTNPQSHSAGVEPYLKGMLEELNALQRLPQKQITYCAKDIPLLHYFNFGGLAAFKLFFWQKSILNQPSLQKQRFSIAAANPGLIALGRQALDLYCRIPSAEIWSDETINSTIRQIQFCAESGFFEQSSDADLLYDQLLELTEHLFCQAGAGTKFMHGATAGTTRFDFYINEIILGHNTILVNANGNLRTHLAYDVLDFLTTTDKAFSESIEQMIRNTIRKSSLISGINEKERHKFFRHCQQKIRNRSVIA